MKLTPFAAVLPVIVLAKPLHSEAPEHSKHSSIECRLVWPSSTLSTSAIPSPISNTYSTPASASTSLTSTSFSVTSTISTITSSSSFSIPTIFLAGDSKMAPKGGGNGTEGWGEYLHYSFNSSTVYINNLAVAGRSARSYTREGRFQKIADVVKAGDWVVIEFGTNDGGSPYPATSDNGRADCPGFDSETCPTVYLNATEVVQTYVTYLKNASSIFLSKGAKVILASPTPNNPWEFGNYSYTPTQFTYGAWLSAQELGGPAAGVYFVPHSDYAAQAMYNLGPLSNIKQYFPLDHGHTAPYLAGVVAQAFVLGLKCGGAPLQGLVTNVTARIEGSLLGTCVLANATLPI